MRRALLDVNVLLALLDSDHADHLRARRWLQAEIQGGWASCPITQNGFVRVISQPRYPSPVSPARALHRLGAASATEHHAFWPCSVDLLDADAFDHSRLQGPKQVTDAYLLALAVDRGGRLVTFDRAVPIDAVRLAGPEHLHVL